MAQPINVTEVLDEDFGLSGSPFINIEQTSGIDSMDLEVGFCGMPFFGHPFSSGTTFLPIISIFMGGD